MAISATGRPTFLAKPVGSCPTVFTRALPCRKTSIDRIRGCCNSKPCHAEVLSIDSDNPESLVDKFERSFKRTNVYFEFRRRQQFENKQDEIKRKRKEKAFKRRQVFYSTFFDTVQGGLNVPPFSDLFDDYEDDLFSDESLFPTRRQNS